MTIARARPGGKLEPFDVKGVQPGSLMSGTLDYKMARQIEKFILNETSTQQSWVWPDPDTAPTATVVTVETEYAFKLGEVDSVNPDLNLPWFCQDGFTGIDLFAKIAMRPGIPRTMYVKADVDDLVVAVASTESPYSSSFDTREALMNKWDNTDDGFTWNFYNFRFKIEPSAFASDRRFTIQFSAAWYPPTGVDVYGGLNPEHEVKLAALYAKDYLREPA